MSHFLWGLSHAKKSEAWLAYRDRPVARPIAIDDYLSRGGKPAFCRAAAICSADSDVSTSTRRVAGSVLTVALASRVRIVFFTVLAQPPQVMSSIWNCMVNSFCVVTVASLGLASVGRSSVISGLTDALSVHDDEDGATPLRYAPPSTGCAAQTPG
ncbi:hypothetical protein PA139_4111 [Salmonella enterica subsp. enterica serovar Paratyphi A]|uniref:Uncharacterized protein n=2 Tax=Salmonella paratyphi A TaxID=54388 RepID=A0A6C7I1U4_SALPK|nr:hypothetical protein SPA2369 [Salmonella enterica subsp. enterica serovar Paratyphi A str. ATCC 9150]CAR60422.1 hypothetical protein SSPA2209 [Salmonella enterica subsp. enterica serovar Paratyphi A str. AKU_12601]CDU50380.1 hypothetical protein PA136_4043 [Salmonella enterica subsp. enterica serovar Paratyphi A]CDU50381.1 hypothetical protein PA142_4097 [Salmonella enterica subsp. enterica serovar Paratyphi A]CDU71232.1 hypothetical protein PA123_2868 [Salmonella enterica subsp. enterica se